MTCEQMFSRSAVSAIQGGYTLLLRAHRELLVGRNVTWARKAVGSGSRSTPLGSALSGRSAATGSLSATGLRRRVAEATRRDDERGLGVQGPWRGPKARPIAVALLGEKDKPKPETASDGGIRRCKQRFSPFRCRAHRQSDTGIRTVPQSANSARGTAPVE